MASTYDLIIKTTDQTSATLKRIENNLKAIERQANRINLSGGGGIASAKTAAGAGAVAGAIARIPAPLIAASAAAGTAAVAFNGIINTSKEFQNLQNGLRLITNGTADLNATFGQLQNAARETRQTLSATSELYTKISISTKDLGANSNDVLKVTKNLSKAMVLAGADTATSEAVIRQFSQAMASGTFQGDEFRSVAEGLGPALALMAEETGLNVAALRKLSREGKLTNKVMFEMIKNSTALESNFAKLALTTDQLETRLGQTFDELIVELDKALGITDKYNKGLSNTEDALGKIRNVLRVINTPLKQFKEEFNTLIDKKAFDDAVNNVNTRLRTLRTPAIKTFLGDEWKGEYQELVAMLVRAKTAQSNLTDTTKKGMNAQEKFAKQLKQVVESTKQFESFASLSPLKEAESNLANVTSLLQEFTEATNMGVGETKENAKVLTTLRRAQENLIETVARLKKEQADAAEADKRRTDVQYDLTQSYRENEARLKKIQEQIAALSDRTADYNGSLAEQYTVLAGLRAEEERLQKALGRKQDIYGKLIADYDAVAKKVTNLKNVQERFRVSMNDNTEEGQRAAFMYKQLGEEITRLQESIGRGDNEGSKFVRGTVDQLIALRERLHQIKSYQDTVKESGDSLWKSYQGVANWADAATIAIEKETVAIQYQINAMLGLPPVTKSFEALYRELLKNIEGSEKLTAQNKQLFDKYNDGTRSVEQLKIAKQLLNIEDNKEVSASGKIIEGLIEKKKRIDDLTEALKEQNIQQVMAANPALKGMEDEYRNTLQKDLNGLLGKEESLRDKLNSQYKRERSQLDEINALIADTSALDAMATKYGTTRETIMENLKKMREGISLYKTSVKDLGDVIKETFKEASKTMVSELSRGIVQGKGILDSFKNAFNNLLDTMLQKILESQINNALFNLTGGFVGSQTKMNPAGLFGGKIIPGFLAEGGPAQPGKPYIVGEKGPELFLPKSGGQVVSNSDLNSMGSGGETQVVFQIQAIDTQTGVEFLLKNKPQIIGMVTQAQNQRGRQGITA